MGNSMSTIFSFGEWVRRQRKSLDLTQEALAGLVNCAVITIKKIEMDERHPSRLMAERLADCLSIPQEERVAFLQVARGERATYRLPLPAGPGVSPVAAPASNLPAPATPLVGRRKELTEASLLLRRHARLLTLTGTGGVGKSHLALELAHKLRPNFPGGVFFVSCASIHDPDLVLSKIAEALKIKENAGQTLQETVLEQIGQQVMLLLLDNFEHLLLAATLVADLLSSAPGLRILITSRTPLQLSNEHLLALHPLSLPTLQPEVSMKADFSDLARSEAVRLFVSRVRVRSPEYKLSQTTAPLVAEICQHLDGLPLAIELAAAQVSRMPVEKLHSRMEHRLDILTQGFRDFPSRHQGLRRTFDWSFDRLDASEQCLFSRLGVFSGGFTLEAVDAVCSLGSPQPVLEGLVDKNMVINLDGARYDMLETIREYAVERLGSAGEIESTRFAHLEYYTKLMETAEPLLWGTEFETWRPRIIADLDNIRAALRWSLERHDSMTGEIELGARIAGASWYFWFVFGRSSEARRWLEIALQKVPQAGDVRAKLLVALGSLIWQQGDLPAAPQAMSASVALYRALHNDHGLAEATHILAHLIFDQQQYPEANDIFHESVALYQSFGNQVMIGTLISDLGMTACHLGDLPAARKYYEESIALFDRENANTQKGQACIRLGDIARQEGDYREAKMMYQRGLQINRELKIRRGIGWANQKLGFIALHEGDFRRAQALFTESLGTQVEAGNQQGIAESLAGLASSLVMIGDGERAARFFGAASGILTRTGMPLAPVDLLEWQRDEAQARASCDPAGFTKAWAEGEALNLKQAAGLVD